MIRAYVGLGSNLSEPCQQLLDALRALGQSSGVRVLGCSSFYASAPMGPQDQPDFVNAVALLETSLSAHELLDKLQQIEQRQGRVRKTQRWGARTLDLDLILFGDQSIATERLTVPHYGMTEREFVLYPLYELSCELILPDGTSLTDLLQSRSKKGLQKILNAADVWKSVTGSV